MNKQQQYHLALLATTRIKGINKYNRIFLGTMLLRKIRHPEESLRTIVQKTSKTMETRYSNHVQKNNTEEQMRKIGMQVLNQTEDDYGKSYILQVQEDRKLDELQEALEKAILPEDCKLNSENVSSVFKYLQKEVRIFLELGNIEELNDDEIIFIADLYKKSKLHSDLSVEELVKMVMQDNGEDVSEQSVKSKLEDLETVNLPEDWDEEGLSGILTHLKLETEF